MSLAVRAGRASGYRSRARRDAAARSSRQRCAACPPGTTATGASRIPPADPAPCTTRVSTSNPDCRIASAELERRTTLMVTFTSSIRMSSTRWTMAASTRSNTATADFDVSERRIRTADCCRLPTGMRLAMPRRCADGGRWFGLRCVRRHALSGQGRDDRHVHVVPGAVRSVSQGRHRSVLRHDAVPVRVPPAGERVDVGRAGPAIPHGQHRRVIASPASRPHTAIAR